LTGGRDRPLTDAQAVAIDEKRGILYIGGGEDLLLVDTEEWALIGATRVGAVTGTFGLALDPASGKVYLLDSVRGELVILSGQGQ
ncbi:MAG TPA: hypothetical protein VMW79_00800, partial [Anaerolineae bacterium]|nr:hypothetical protein [Anaerolineae bacterium]